MNIRKTSGRVIALAMGLAVVAASCGSDASTEESGGADDRDATMTFMYYTSASSNLDPHTSGNYAQTFLYPVFDSLFILNDGQPEPSLATGWEFSDDGLTLTLSLREGVVFQDGTPFDADAVVANLERAQQVDGSNVARTLANVASVEAVDTSTVEIGLSAPDVALLAVLADKAGMMMSPATFDSEDLSLNPVGAGPYRVVEHQPGSVVRYERFEDYWEPDAVKLAGLDIRIAPDDTTRLNALRAGDVDAIVLPPDLVGSAESAGFSIQAAQTGNTYILNLNMGAVPLNDPQVRKALSLAIDREGINQAVFDGTCTPTSQLWAPPGWAHDPDVPAETYAFDPEAARDLLAEAGYPDGFDLDMVTFPSPLYVRTAEALQAQFADVGVNVNLEAIEGVQIISRFMTDRTTPSYLGEYTGEVDPSIGVANLYAPTGRYNPGEVEAPEITELNAQALAEQDPAARADLYRRITEVAVENVLHIPVCAGTTMAAVRDGVEGIQINGLSYFDLRDVGVSAS